MKLFTNGGKPNHLIKDELDCTMEEFDAAKPLIHTFTYGDIEVGTPHSNPMLNSMHPNPLKMSFGLMMIDESKIKRVMTDYEQALLDIEEFKKENNYVELPIKCCGVCRYYREYDDDMRCFCTLMNANFGINTTWVNGLCDKFES